MYTFLPPYLLVPFLPLFPLLSLSLFSLLLFSLLLLLLSYRQSVADIIAQYVITILSNHSTPWPSELVFSCLLVCRQLYNTSEGVLALLPYKLHLHLAKAIERGSTEERDRLVDNLLNFAGTPKVWLII